MDKVNNKWVVEGLVLVKYPRGKCEKIQARTYVRDLTDSFMPSIFDTNR